MAFSGVAPAILAALLTFPGNFRAASFSLPLPRAVFRKVSEAQTTSSPQHHHHLAAKKPSEELKLPPKDDSFGLIGTVRTLLALPDVPKNSNKYERIGQETGGIWRSEIMGTEASTIVATPQSKRWITMEEAAGNIVQELPKSTREIMGSKALMNMGTQPKAHAIARKAFSRSLSPKATLALEPVVEASLGKRMRRLEKFAASGEEIALGPDIQAYTLEVIAHGFLGDYATDDVVAEIGRFLPPLLRGMFSFPRSFPWPLNRIPIFGFRRAMDAREGFQRLLEGLIRERRTDLRTNGAKKNGGVVDEFLRMQKEQMDAGGPEEGGVVFDDDFVYDNVILGLFAGYSTSAVTLMRIVELIGSAEGKKIADQLMDELEETVSADDDKLEEKFAGHASIPASGIFGAFPLLDAIVLETNRIYPTVGNVIRKSVQGASYNGYTIPAGQTINWSLVDGFRADSLYSDAAKFCPFRFMQGRKAEKQRSTMLATGGAPTTTGTDEVRPEMFGFGRHMCPGRELAKLEILLFLRTFLRKFDYDLVDGQSFKGVLPSNEPKGKLRVILRARATT